MGARPGPQGPPPFSHPAARRFTERRGGRPMATPVNVTHRGILFGERGLIGSERTARACAPPERVCLEGGPFGRIRPVVALAGRSSRVDARAPGAYSRRSRRLPSSAMPCGAATAVPAHRWAAFTPWKAVEAMCARGAKRLDRASASRLCGVRACEGLARSCVDAARSETAEAGVKGANTGVAAHAAAS